MTTYELFGSIFIWLVLIGGLVFCIFTINSFIQHAGAIDIPNVEMVGQWKCVQQVDHMTCNKVGAEWKDYPLKK